MKSIIYVIILILCIACSTSQKKIQDSFLHGTWFLTGEYCDEKGQSCKEPRKNTIVEFTEDGAIIINQNLRIRKKYSLYGTYFKIEHDNKKITIHKLDDNTFLTEEKNILSKFMRVKG